MTHDVAFFLAPDDESAAATRNTGPWQFRSLTFHYFDPDDAVVEWARHFEAPDRPFAAGERLANGRWPHYVADFLNDGVGMFVMQEVLVTALAAAEPDELRGVAARWGQFLVDSNETDLSPEEQLAVVQGVAELASAAVESAGALHLYCWQW